MASIWDNPHTLEVLEDKRERLRKPGHRLTFDCFNTRIRGGDRVICSKGQILSARSPTGSMYLASVLNGRTARICQHCPQYDGDDQPIELARVPFKSTIVIPLTELELSTVTRNMLRRGGGIETVADLLPWEPKQILRIRNVGKGRIKELSGALVKIGIKWGLLS